MSMLPRLLALLLCLSLAGCGWFGGQDGIFRDRGEDYRKARLEPALSLPPGLSGNAIDDAYPIPALENAHLVTLGGRFEVPRPDPLEGDPSAQGVKIQRLGNHQWILVESSPGQVWPQLRAFLNQVQLPVARIDPGLGIIETGWFEPAEDSLRRERYRFRIEQGVQRGSSELFVLHDQIGGDDWPEVSDNIERENAMVQELSQFMANNAAEGVVSMVAERALDSRGKVFVRRDEDLQAYLDLQLPFLRAWGALSLALEKAGLEVDDLNRSERRYWVHALPEADTTRCGWFRRLFGCGRVDSEAIRHYILEMRPAGDSAVTLHVSDGEGHPLPKQEADQLLSRIKGFIS